ncbi:spermatogenesis-associated protein 17-like [Octopus sinensis]|uniref:Spermatogenesis-associated protein 17-like n=1 Tax=Octopus sinensis TaxID=2607531 RepID=A0A7E6F8P2_9MOLL|nr:spermatogenesis-associated protein 17-like [Octopus sinensis]
MSHLQYLNFRVECQLIKQLYVKRNRAQRPLSMPLYKLKVWIEDSKFALRTDAAIVIQRNWRGYKARVYFAHYFWTRYYEKCINHYEKMATKIQKVWKGYYSRKYILNFYKRKDQLKLIIEKNSYYLTHITEFVKKKSDIEKEILMNYKKEVQKTQAYKKHHLISTAVIPGVYNSPFGQNHEAENFLKSLCFTGKKPRKKPPDITHEGYEQLVSEKSAGLQKPQGPFLNPEQVMRKRYKPLNPNLQTETDVDHLVKAWNKFKTELSQKHYGNFCLPSKVDEPKYEPRICNDTPYKLPVYGRLNFREYKSCLSTGKKDFKKILPPVSVVDKCKQEAG